jgi:hypothetical protein
MLGGEVSVKYGWRTANDFGANGVAGEWILRQ